MKAIAIKKKKRMVIKKAYKYHTLTRCCTATNAAVNDNDNGKIV